MRDVTGRPDEFIVFKNRFGFTLSKDGALALYAAIYQRPDLVSPEWYDFGQRVYQMFCMKVQELATNFDGVVGGSSEKRHPQ